MTSSLGTTRYFILATAILLALFASHLFQFTLFNEFATLSSDSANYVLMARKWSPYFLPTLAETGTWPAHSYPPGLAWFLALTGSSESLYHGHLFVSLCLLLSLAFIAVYVRIRAGSLIALTSLILLAMLPGTLVNTMGILSENLYLLLSCVGLGVFLYCEKEKCRSPGIYLVLALVVYLLVMTRTIGLAFSAALVLKALLDRRLDPTLKQACMVIAAVSVLGWWSWSKLDPQPHGVSYTDLLAPVIKKTFFDVSVDSISLWLVIGNNLKAIPIAWHNYFSLSNNSLASVMISGFAMLVVIACLALRALRFKFDAMYAVCYVAILLFWPFSTDDRFIHPIVAIILLQPLFLIVESNPPGHRRPLLIGFALAAWLLSANSALIHKDWVKTHHWARQNYPALTHSLELYRDPYQPTGFDQALAFAHVRRQMAATAEVISDQGAVASVKHVFHALLSNRRAHPLVGNHPESQLLCNLQIENINYRLRFQNHRGQKRSWT